MKTKVHPVEDFHLFLSSKVSHVPWFNGGVLEDGNRHRLVLERERQPEGVGAILPLDWFIACYDGNIMVEKWILPPVLDFLINQTVHCCMENQQRKIRELLGIR